MKPPAGLSRISWRRIQSIAPVLLFVPYVAWVLQDRMASHVERRKEIDEARELARLEKLKQPPADKK
jgi:hypothetical protein